MHRAGLCGKPKPFAPIPAAPSYITHYAMTLAGASLGSSFKAAEIVDSELLPLLCLP